MVRPWVIELIRGHTWGRRVHPWSLAPRRSLVSSVVADNGFHSASIALGSSPGVRLCIVARLGSLGCSLGVVVVIHGRWIQWVASWELGFIGVCPGCRQRGRSSGFTWVLCHWVTPFVFSLGVHWGSSGSSGVAVFTGWLGYALVVNRCWSYRVSAWWCALGVIRVVRRRGCALSVVGFTRGCCVH